jgi:hypothetical protein
VRPQGKKSGHGRRKGFCEAKTNENGFKVGRFSNIALQSLFTQEAFAVSEDRGGRGAETKA